MKLWDTSRSSRLLRNSAASPVEPTTGELFQQLLHEEGLPESRFNLFGGSNSDGIRNVDKWLENKVKDLAD